MNGLWHDFLARCAGRIFDRHPLDVARTPRHTSLVPLRGRPLSLDGCDDARAVPCTFLGPRSPCRGLPSRHARQLYVAPTTHGATAAPQSLSVNPPQTYHATPHSTTRRHTSHPPPSPPYTHLFPLRAKGRVLLPCLPCPTLAHVGSRTLTLSRPPLQHHHQYHTVTGPALPSFSQAMIPHHT